MLHIMTLTWDALPMLSTLWKSLEPALEGIDYKWHIKDNGSKDGTAAVAATWGPNVISYAYPNNDLTFAEGMNWIYEQAKPADDDLILLLNNDIEFNDTVSLKKMIALLNDRDAGMVGARLKFTNTNKLQHAGVIFEPSHRMPIHFRAGQESDALAEKNREFQAVTGALVLTRSSYYKKVCTTNKSGRVGMDEKYRWAFEDIDMCLAIKYNENKPILYCGETNISHGESVSLKKNPVNKLFMNPNVEHFRGKWQGKYALDRALYLRDPALGQLK